VISSVSVIQSRQNVRYKQWQHYVDHPEEPTCPWISAEGWKLVGDLSAQRPIELLLFSNPEDPRLQVLLSRSRTGICISRGLLDRLSSVGSPQGLVGFFSKPVWDWPDLTPWILYLDRLQDPGNLGTLLRTARATGIFSLVSGPETVSCFNSKVVRASAGALFAVPFLEEISVPQLKAQGYAVWRATPTGGSSLFEADFRPPVAILVGNEGTGLGRLATDWSEHELHIPMQSPVESLNAGVAGSLILYEVFRQREGDE
jgi:TrmH family RNA methyltransferase